MYEKSGKRKFFDTYVRKRKIHQRRQQDGKQDWAVHFRKKKSDRADAEGAGGTARSDE